MVGFLKLKGMLKKLFTIALLLVTVATNAQDLDRLLNLRGDWKFSIGDNTKWAEVNYDDSSWEEIYVPRRWESEGFNGYDGYAWYRTKFSGDELEKEGAHYLRLAT